MTTEDTTSGSVMSRAPKSGRSLSYQGMPIADRSDMLSLTDMWKAAGAPEHREPFNWSRKEGAPFIEAVALSHNLTDGQIMTTKRGKGGATFAHWQIGLAYAKYLSPEFHMWCNEVVREKMEAKASQRLHGLTAVDKSSIGGIVKTVAASVFREQVSQLLPALVSSEVAGRLGEQNLLLRRGHTARQIWDGHNLPGRIRGTTVWLGNRLAEMSCSIEYCGRADRGNGTVRLFDPDKSAICMRNGLLQKAQAYAAKRLGQGRLRLVGGAK